MPSSPFRCQQFEVDQTGAAHPVGTDGMLLGAWAEVRPTDRHILDIGTGTGLMALMLAQRTAHLDVVLCGVEMHGATARCAARNFAASKWSDRISLVEMPIQNYAASYAGPKFDLVVCNPPFFTETTVSPDADRRIGRSAQTLTVRDLIISTLQILHPNGRLCVVLPVREARELAELATTMGLYWTRRTVVHGRPDRPAERWLLQLERHPHRVQFDTMSIYDQFGTQRSAAFAALTADFYLT
jgi:tRNA1Val (adenine37-N6)-methyltransferase